MLILRAWVDGPAAGGLRVRVILVHSSGQTLVTSAASVETTADLVASWLNDVLRRADSLEHH